MFARFLGREGRGGRQAVQCARRGAWAGGRTVTAVVGLRLYPSYITLFNINFSRLLGTETNWREEETKIIDRRNRRARKKNPRRLSVILLFPFDSRA